VLWSEQLAAPPLVAEAMGDALTVPVALIDELNTQIHRLEEQFEHRSQQPDATIIRSRPGLGTILGARVRAEFGDDPSCYAYAKQARAIGGARAPR
jgi:transposase